jgi:hypothetical protein
MEALLGFEHKFNYTIIGHSGDAAQLTFVPYEKPPKTVRERLDVLEAMATHSQYCSSGDRTVEATSVAVWKPLLIDFCGLMMIRLKIF